MAGPVPGGVGHPHGLVVVGHLDDPELAGKEMRAHIEFFGASVISHLSRT